MPGRINPAIGCGRGITNYLPKCELNAQLKSAMHVTTDSEYRKQLQAQPQQFDTVARGMVQFTPYWPVSPCPPQSK